MIRINFHLIRVALPPAIFCLERVEAMPTPKGERCRGSMRKSYATERLRVKFQLLVIHILSGYKLQLYIYMIITMIIYMITIAIEVILRV
jgi:hypothetical protein